MRIAITGAAGFTGRHLAGYLVARGDEPVALSADVTDVDAVKREIADVRPDAVIHLAAKAFVQSDDVQSFYAVNQIGTLHLLDAITSARPGITVLLASSAQVYGAQAAGLIDEEAALAPSNHYAVSKAAMEMAANLYSSHIRLIVARPFNYTGVGQQNRYLVPKIVSHFAKRAERIELGNLDVQRDFGDVRAVVAAYAGLLGAAPGIYNVSSGALHSVRDLLGALTRLTGHDLAVDVNPAFVRPNDVPVLGGRNNRLRAALPDWQPLSIDDTLAWMLDHAATSGKS
ncbi:GDP-mannose 4,6-dehydratase [Sphingomonas cynarae]|uniref:GDP-mannose 4,6-dehydratase n=1 Tax=Sphingomonas cynarae TaxID=930197 RepID=A0ABP7ESY2_9SPHN